MNWKDIGIRAAKTAVQAAVTAIVANAALFSGITDWDSAKGVLLTVGMAAGSAAVSAAWNIISQALEDDVNEQ